MPYPAKLKYQEHDRNAFDRRSFEDFDVSDENYSVNVENRVEAMLLETFKEWREIFSGC